MRRENLKRKKEKIVIEEILHLSLQPTMELQLGIEYVNMTYLGIPSKQSIYKLLNK